MTIRRNSSTSDSKIDTAPSRSAGVLDQDEIAFCRENNIPLAYDTAQIGWVLDAAHDDIIAGLPQTKAGWEANITAQTKKQQRFNAREPQYAFRAWNDSDVETFQKLLDDPDVWVWLPEDYPAPLTAEIASTLIELSNASAHHMVRAILCDDEIVGQIRLQYDIIKQDRAVAEISYWLGRAHWGKGIGSQAVRAFTADSFDTHPDVNAIIARVHNANTASRRVLEKAGYQLAGPDPQDANWTILRVDAA